MNFCKLLLLVLVLATLGCAQGTVVAIDTQGKRMQGVEVEPVSLSINGAPVMTDEKGRAKIPLFIGQEVVWVQASKPGYVTRHLDVTGDWPMVIEMQAG